MSNAASTHQYSQRFTDNFITGLPVSWASNTTLTIGAGSCIDSQNQTNIVIDSTLTLNAAVNGVVNGMDQGSLAANTWYGLFAIRNSLVSDDSIPQGFLLSTSFTNPALPPGYDSFRLRKRVLTDNSSHFLLFDDVGDGNWRFNRWDSAISVVSGGSATSLTPIVLTAAVPAVDSFIAKIEAQFTPATGNDFVQFAPFGSTSTSLPALYGSANAKINSGQFEILYKLDSGVPKILYKNSASSGATTVLVSGYWYKI